ncbi:hypothetical protein PLESTM_001717500 [Pleodorina starrii]|nr:hypothetical protein PLESTM_001717500 [Pleodorina starrii]
MSYITAKAHNHFLSSKRCLVTLPPQPKIYASWTRPLVGGCSGVILPGNPQPGHQRPHREPFVCHASSSNLPAWQGGEGHGQPPARSLTGNGNGVFLLMLLCCLVFIADNLLHLPGCATLYLNHARPQWWQFVTHMFCHGNFAHLSGNLFNLCVFGKMVEETEGAAGVVTTFVLCGLGAALATFFLTPATSNGHVTVSVGASGAIFGLFAVSVLTRLRWNLKQLLEAVVLGQFVVRQVLEEAKNQVAGGLMVGGMAVSHAAHLAGAAVGVLLVLLLQGLPDPGGK